MYIKSLTIKNFRCFGKGEDGNGTTIEFNNGLSAFIGKNGSGKTSILEALNYLISQDYLQNRISEKDFHHEAIGIKEVDAIVIEGKTFKPFFIKVDVVSDTNQAVSIVVPCEGVRLSIKRREKPERVLDDPFIINKSVIPITGEINEALYSGADFTNSYKITTLEEIDNEIKDLETAKEVIKNSLLGKVTGLEKHDKFFTAKFKLKSSQERTTSFPFYSLGFNSNRIKGLPKSYYLSKDRGEDVAGSYSLISKVLTDLHWKYKREHTKQESNGITTEYESLSQSLRSLVDDKGKLINQINKKVKEICSSDKDFQFDFIDIEQPYKSAFITKKEGVKLLMPENLGSGFNILIAYSLFTCISEQEKTPIVFIIDEPELHLHTDWQQKMYNLFCSQPKIQIVYSTQSENFVSIKEWGQIRHIENLQIFPQHEILNEVIQSTDGESATRSKFLDDYAKRNLHISSILKENLQLFFSEKCLLVEGPGEKYALPKLISLKGCKLENYSITIIPAWGKNKIKNYQMICKAFGINYFTVFDTDKDGDEIDDDNNQKENAALVSNALDNKVVQFSSSFESLLNVNGNGKFQKLTKTIDELATLENVDQEIQEAIVKIKDFIVS